MDKDLETRERIANLKAGEDTQLDRACDSVGRTRAGYWVNLNGSEYQYKTLKAVFNRLGI